MFSGYKTFVVAAAVVFIGVVEGLLGFDIPGVTVGSDWVVWVLSGLGLGSMRDAIRKLVDMFSGN